MNRTNPSRLKKWNARLAAEAERRAGQTSTAAMKYEVAEAHRVRARQVAAAKRAECKQRLNAKRSSHPVVAPGAPREYKPNNRGGKNTQLRCTTCGELRRALIQGADALLLRLSVAVHSCDDARVCFMVPPRHQPVVLTPAMDFFGVQALI